MNVIFTIYRRLAPCIFICACLLPLCVLMWRKYALILIGGAIILAATAAVLVARKEKELIYSISFFLPFG